MDISESLSEYYQLSHLISFKLFLVIITFASHSLEIVNQLIQNLQSCCYDENFIYLENLSIKERSSRSYRGNSYKTGT